MTFEIEIDGTAYTTQEALNNKLRGYSGKLDLFQIKIGSEGAKALATTLMTVRNNVTEIDLGGGNIKDDGAKALAGALRDKDCKVTRINLAGNNIGDDGAKELADALHQPDCNVTSITLHLNNIGDDGAKALAEALRAPNCNVTRITFALNNIGDDDAYALASALGQEECKVKHIALDNTNINSTLKDKIEAMAKLSGAERKGAYRALKLLYSGIQKAEDRMRPEWERRDAEVAAAQPAPAAIAPTPVAVAPARVRPPSAPAVRVKEVGCIERYFLSCLRRPKVRGLDTGEIVAVRTAMQGGGGIAHKKDVDELKSVVKELEGLKSEVAKLNLNDSQSKAMTGLYFGVDNTEEIDFLKTLVRNGGDAFKSLLTNLSSDANHDAAFGDHLDKIVENFNDANPHLNTSQKETAAKRLRGFARSYMKALKSMEDIGALVRNKVIKPQAFTHKQHIADMLKTGAAAVAEFEPTGIAGMIVGTVAEQGLGQMISSNQRTITRHMDALNKISHEGRTGEGVTRQIFGEHVLHMTEHMAENKRSLLIGDDREWKKAFSGSNDVAIDKKMETYFGRAMEAMTEVANNIDQINEQSPSSQDVMGRKLYDNADGNGTVTPVDHAAALLSHGALTNMGRTAETAANATLQHHKNMVARGYGRSSAAALPLSSNFRLTESQRQAVADFRQPDLSALSPISRRSATELRSEASRARNFGDYNRALRQLDQIGKTQRLETEVRSLRQQVGGSGRI